MALDRARLAVEVVAAYPRARRAARVTDIRDALARLREGEREPRSRPVDDDVLAEGLRLGRAVTRTLRLLPGDSRCLTRALVLTHLLARRGVASALVIGVRPGDRFAAHAWVELGGRPLLPSGEGEYQRLTDL